MRRMAWAAAASLVLASGGVGARDLPVPAGKGWQHAETGLILRTTLAGLPRTRLTDAGEAERDVIAQFNDADDANSATVYLFHPGTDSVPIWFDRSEEALRHRDTYGGVTPATPAPVAFAPPRTGVPAGLRRVYVPAKGPYRATALAVMPLGDWLVAVRYSSAALDPAALDAKLTAIVAELGWPASAAAPVAAAVPVVACATTLHYRKARVKQPDMMQALLGASLAMTARSKAPGAAPVAETVEPLCRDGEASVAYAVYRAPGRTDGYLLALADAGVTVGVDRAFSLPGSADGGWGVTLHDVNGSDHIFASFDALPRPEQVVELVTHGSPVSSTAANGREVTIGIAPGK